MRSPFPGMDPYLEGSFWTTVHADLTAQIVRQLAPRLRPRYLALTERRFILDAPEGIEIEQTEIYADVGVAERLARGGNGAATAVLDPPLQMEAATPTPSPIPQRWIEIRDVLHRRLVAIIEVLSPTNKRGSGHAEFTDRKWNILSSSAHLVEIDLLRDGKRFPTRDALPDAAYFIFVSRAQTRPVVDVWPVSIRASLPTVPVPLLEGDADVPLDLHEALATIYDAVSYDLAVNYQLPPEIPLPPDDDAWADTLLRSAGMRK